jgi:hypothetical protein
MSTKQKAVSEESFEFIKTPPAASPQVVAPDVGVRTTAVSTHCSESTLITLVNWQNRKLMMLFGCFLLVPNHQKRSPSS